MVLQPWSIQREVALHLEGPVSGHLHVFFSSEICWRFKPYWQINGIYMYIDRSDEIIQVEPKKFKPFTKQCRTHDSPQVNSRANASGLVDIWRANVQKSTGRSRKVQNTVYERVSKVWTPPQTQATILYTSLAVGIG